MSHAKLPHGHYPICRVAPGLKTYDADGNLIGTVESIDRTLGTMRVATNPFFEQPLMVRLDMITATNARELVLSCTLEELGNSRGAFQHPAGGEEVRR